LDYLGYSFEEYTALRGNDSLQYVFMVLDVLYVDVGSTYAKEGCSAWARTLCDMHRLGLKELTRIFWHVRSDGSLIRLICISRSCYNKNFSQGSHYYFVF